MHEGALSMADDKSSSRYRFSIEYAIDGIHILDIDGNVLDVNQAFCDMLGYTRAEILRMRVSDWDAQWNEAEIKAKIRDVVGRQQFFETLHRRKDGTLINVEVAVATSAFEGQTLLFASARDITKRKRAEAARHESDERFRVLVEQSIAGLYVIQDGAIVYVNPRCAEIFGYQNIEEILGRPIQDFVIPAERASVTKGLGRKLSGQIENSRCTFRALRGDGTETEIGVDGRPSIYGGRPAIMGLLQDISERKSAERQILDYVARLERALRSTVQVASTIGEMRDPYTAGHEQHVSEIAVAIGAELGLDETQCDGLRVIGLLHDIGKINIPAEILAKPRRLSDLEYALVKQHPQQGHEILKGVEFRWPVSDTVLQHHERMDGSGYPHGLKGDQIILEARIVAVADTLEAMAAHRPYRAGLGLDLALEEIESGSGAKYDPEVAGACLRIFREKGFALPT